MGGVVGEPISRADVNPPALFADPHARFILGKHWTFDQRRFDRVFHRGQVVMTRLDKAGDAASREVHAEQIVQELAGASRRHHLALDERNGQRLNAGSIVGRGFDCCRKAGSCQMRTGRTVLFFNSVLRHPEAFGWQIDHLASLWQFCRAIVEISLTVFAPFDRMDQHHIGCVHLSEVMASMAFVPTWLLATFLPQALGGTHTPIGRGRQVAVVALFGLLCFQGFHTLF